MLYLFKITCKERWRERYIPTILTELEQKRDANKLKSMVLCVVFWYNRIIVFLKPAKPNKQYKPRWEWKEKTIFNRMNYKEKKKNEIHMKQIVSEWKQNVKNINRKRRRMKKKMNTNAVQQCAHSRNFHTERIVSCLVSFHISILKYRVVIKCYA